MTLRSSPQEDSTERSDPKTDEKLARSRLGAAHHDRLSLVAYHPKGSVTSLLESGAPVVIGRRPPATLCVPSAKLSRTHARFSLAPGGRVKVQDLGSTNGTWLRGERVEEAEITLGDEVMVGDTLVCVQAAGRPERPAASSAARGEAPADEPIAASPAMREALRTAEQVAASSLPVVLSGETGTGKEVLARFLHERGPRARGPLICVNCAAIPGSLVEAALFGHERGSFTGAGQQQKGVFEEADGGTLFLDEIGELPLAAQAALLRVLETGRFARVGSSREIAVDVRVIAATHRDLEALCESGGFRADLYYRLGVMVISIPPLRERREDIEPLARRFLGRVAGRVRDLTPAALALLRSHGWPGNVRELRNTVDRAVVLARGDVIDVADLPARMREAGPEAARARGEQSAPPSDAPPSGSPADLRGRVQEYEARMLLDVLEAAGWNQAEAARRMGIPKRTFAYRVKSLGLKPPPKRP